MSYGQVHLDDWLRPLTISDEKLHFLARDFSKTYKYLALNSTAQFLPTPYTKLPTGEEKGTYLAIDLGGTNLRVGFIELLGSDPEPHQLNRRNGAYRLSKPTSNGHIPLDGHLLSSYDTVRDSQDLSNGHALTNGDALSNGHGHPNGHAFKNDRNLSNGHTLSNCNTLSDGHAISEGYSNSHTLSNGHTLSGGHAFSEGHSKGQRILRSHERAWHVEEHLKEKDAQALFAWLADRIAEVVRAFVDDASEAGDVVPNEFRTGLTFSFPMKQTSHADATLLPMGKGFAMTSNLDLGGMLLDGYEKYTKRPALEKDGLTWTTLPNLNIVAISNDSVAALASSTYTTSPLPLSKVAMALIVGTGCNATIPMKPEDLHPSKRAPDMVRTETGLRRPEIVVNTEWTINGAAGPLRKLDLITRWDVMLDEATSKPGFQPFEYMTAGRYLGELVRLVVHDWFVNVLKLDEADLPSMISDRNALTTSFIATSVAGAGSARELAGQLNLGREPDKLHRWIWTVDLAEVLHQATSVVLKRSAAMIAAAVVGLLSCAGEIEIEQAKNEPPTFIGSKRSVTPKNELVVAYTGGLITQYSRHKEGLQKKIDMLLDYVLPCNADTRVVLREALDGTIIGAGVLAGTVWQSKIPIVGDSGTMRVDRQDRFADEYM